MGIAIKKHARGDNQGNQNETGRTETVNFCTIACLLLDVCNDAIRDLLRLKISDDEQIFTQTLETNRRKIESRLFDSQKKILFPQNSGIVSFESLDFSMMYCILRNVCPCKIEPNTSKRKNWGKHPAHGDKSLLAAIETIRECRNELFAHATKAKIQDLEFKGIWTKLEIALDTIDQTLSLSGESSYKMKMGNLKNMSLNPETEKRMQERTEKEGTINALFEGFKKDIDVNLGQTEVFMEKFREENEFYIETKIFENAKQILKQRNCVILIGKEGVGKTAMAVHFMFEYAKYKDFVVRRIRTPHEFYSSVDLRMKNLVFLDNIFEHSESTQSLWKMFDYMQESLSSCMNEKAMFDDQYNRGSSAGACSKSNLHIIIASRPRELDDAVKKMNYKHSLLQNCAVSFELEGAELNEIEKRDILEKKMKFARVCQQIEEENFSDAQWESILMSSTPFGFPLCAHLFACDKACRKVGTTFFSNPQNYMFSKVKTIIQADETRRTEVLFVLMLVYDIRNEPFYFKESKTYLKVLFELDIAKKLQLDDKAVNIEEVVSDHEVYVRKSQELILEFTHPSVQEAVQNYFFETYLENAIDMLPLSKLLPKMHGKYFLKLDPIFQKHFFRRLREEIKLGNVCEVCEFTKLNNRQVSRKLLSHLISDAFDFKDILNTKDNNDDLPFIYWFTFKASNKTILDLLDHETLRTVCSEEELYDQHFYSLLASCALPEKYDVLKFILKKYSSFNIQNQYYYKQASDSLTENPIKVRFSPLMVAVKNSNDDAILLLTKHKATSPWSTWRGWTFLHACSTYDENQICNNEFLQRVIEFEEEGHSNEKDKYADIISDDETTISEKIVIEVDKSIARYGSHKNILLYLVGIPEVEITDALIKAFCSLQDAYECSNLHPLNFVDENGDTVLHLFLKCNSHDDEEFETKSEDKTDLSKTEPKSVASTCTLIEEVVIPDEEFSFYTYRENKDKSKKVRTVQRLLAKKVIDTNLKNKKGETPLLIETSKAMPSFDVIKSLLKYGGNPNEHDLNGQTCLHRIISQTCASTTEVCNFLSILVQSGADANKQDANGNNPIFVEIRNRKPRNEVLRFLLDADTNMNLVDANGRTALNVALQNQDYKDKIEIIETLLSSKHINVLSRDKTNMSAFCIAVSYAERNSEILKRISNHSSCEYPLHECIKEQASEEDKICALKLLLNNNTRELNEHAFNKEKETLLITASKFCPDMGSLFEFLVSLNIDVNAKDIFENTALDYLIESPNDFEFRKRKASISCLLSKHPIVLDEDKQERSPMPRVMQFMMSKSCLCQTNPDMAPFQTIERIRNLSHTQSDKKQNVNKLSDVFVDTDIVRRILEITTADLSTYFGEKGRTYLHYCTSTRFSDENMLIICKRLVELGVDFRKRDIDELTCVDMALKYCGKDNYDTLVYLLNIGKLQDFDVDKALQYLADGNNLHLQIMEFFEENIFIKKRPKINILHYLASIKYNPQFLNKYEREKLFNFLQKWFPVDERNADGKIPLHVAIEEDSSVATVLNFLRISEQCINKADSNGDTALHLVLNSDKVDKAVCTIVKQMLEMKADVNAKNSFFRTPLMVAVKCSQDRLQTVAYILKIKSNDLDLSIKDRSSFTILHHCIEAPKDDITACSMLSLFLDSGLRVPVNSHSNSGLTPLNLAAKTASYSRILCILRLLTVKDCLMETVDTGGRSPLYNTAASLQGTHPLIVLERVIRSYIFLLHGDSPDYNTNFDDNVLNVCGTSNFPILVDLFKIGIARREKVYSIIRPAYDEVARKGLEKNNIIFEKLENMDLWGNLLKEEKMKTLISNSLPYLSYCKLDQLVNEELGDEENQSSFLEFVHDTDV